MLTPLIYQARTGSFRQTARSFTVGGSSDLAGRPSKLIVGDTRWQNWLIPCLFILVLLVASMPVWAEENPLHELLPKESAETLQRHAEKVLRASTKFSEDLQLSTQDERVLLHLPKRGFKSLANLVDLPYQSGAYSTLFMPEINLKSGSKEEAIASELLMHAMVNRVLANRYACFRLVKELAPSPEAMRLEKQAEELREKIGSKPNPWTECAFLDTLESVRALFDQLRDLPQMTPEEFARERAESAVLAPADYLDDFSSTPLTIKKKWPDQALDRQRNWSHEGFLVAYSECVRPGDYERFQMVIKPQGGIFEACQPYSGSHGAPDSFESKLSQPEIHALEEYIATLPPSSASGDEIHYIVSFSKDGNWVTRTYGSLPAGNPFQAVLKRMIQESARGQIGDSPNGAEFLGPGW